MEDGICAGTGRQDPEGEGNGHRMPRGRAGRPDGNAGQARRGQERGGGDEGPAGPGGPGGCLPPMSAEERHAVDAALAIMERRLDARRRPVLRGPQDAAEYLRLRLGTEERELFCALFLGPGNALLGFEVLFYGTADQVVAYPREIAKAALRHGATSVVLAHNHPSGSAEPSSDDVVQTALFKLALALVGVSLLDHLVVTAAEVTSLAGRGEL